MRLFKLLSLLLSYPDEQLREVVPELTTMLRAEAALPAGIAARLVELAAGIETADLLESQERYVALFDQTRSLSLYLFEHVHGESRDRGQAMVDLRKLYEEHGLVMESGELPDFLPLFLEFLDTIPQSEAHALLVDIRPIADSLSQRLLKRKSAYAAVLDALVALAPTATGAMAEGAAVPEEDSAEARDASWAEPPVRFIAAPAPLTAPAGGHS
jgi:nitrate reductase delta subunit